MHQEPDENTVLAAQLARWMYERPGVTIQAAKQAAGHMASVPQSLVYRHLEILELQHDGPWVVRNRHYEALETALGLMEAFESALVQPEVRLSGRLTLGYWNQSAEIRIRVHASAVDVLTVLDPLGLEVHDECVSTRFGPCTAWVDDRTPPMLRVIGVPPSARKFADEPLVTGVVHPPMGLLKVRELWQRYSAGDQPVTE